MQVILITGIQAAGKSSVAQAAAERLDRSVHLRGDLFRRMVVNGRADMGPDNPPAEAVRQLRLRYRLAAQAADGYAEAGFTVVLQDIVLGEYLTEMAAATRTRPLYVVVFAPRPEVAREREDARRLARGRRWKNWWRESGQKARSNRHGVPSQQAGKAGTGIVQRSPPTVSDNRRRHWSTIDSLGLTHPFMGLEAAMSALRSDLAGQQHLGNGSYPSRIEFVAKLSVSLPDDLVRDLKEVSQGNVSAFVAAAVRNELDRRRLHVLVRELEDQVGPVDEAEVARFGAMFARVNAAARAVGGGNS